MQVERARVLTQGDDIVEGHTQLSEPIARGSPSILQVNDGKETASSRLLAQLCLPASYAGKQFQLPQHDTSSSTAVQEIRTRMHALYGPTDDLPPPADQLIANEKIIQDNQTDCQMHGN